MRYCCSLVMNHDPMNLRWRVDLPLLPFRAQLVQRETEERLVRLEKEDTRDTEDSVACRVCPAPL